jgi:uncharacterized damage-inducible protein DinB
MPALNDRWRGIVAQSLGWDQAHATLEHAVERLPAQLRGAVAEGFPHSVWELVDHIRRTQKDLLEFCTNPAYEELKWPDDYWPSDHEPPSDKAWTETLSAIRKDRIELEKFTTDTDIDITARIPHGSGQTYLRTVLLAVDHASYHIGQIIAVRRLLGAWPPK